MNQSDKEAEFKRAYGIDEPSGIRIPWDKIVIFLGIALAYCWIHDIGPFAPEVEFDFHAHALEYDDYIAVDVENRHWRFSKEPRIEAAFRVYGASYLASGERPPDGPWSIVTHNLLVEPLEVNKAKFSRSGHEEDNHSDWTLFTARAADNRVLEAISTLEPIGARQCAVIVGSYPRLLEFKDDELGANQLEWDYQCSGHHRCDSDRVLVIDDIRSVDCNSGL